MKKTFPRVTELIQAEVKRLQSVNKVALALGMTNNTMHKYLAGQSEPQQDTLERLAVYFDKSVAWLRGDTDNDTAPGKITCGQDVIVLSELNDEDRQTFEMLRSLTPAQRKIAAPYLSLLLASTAKTDTVT